MGSFLEIDGAGFVILKNAIMASLLSCITFGIVGTIVTTKKISYMAGSISHTILGGIGIGVFLKSFYNLSPLLPIIGATVFAIGAALIIALTNHYFKERYDSVIGALWPLGMAIGIIFIYKTPGIIDPMNYLFGNILLVNNYDLLMISCLNCVLALFMYLFYYKFISLCFDEDFSKVRGVNTLWLNLVLLILVSISIVLMVNIVGIIMVVAMITIPASIASKYSNKISMIAIIATILSLVFNLTGLYASFYLDLPAGPTIIVIAATAYLISNILNTVFKKGVLHE